jgi:glutaminyl-peptide cyclotransferase
VQSLTFDIVARYPHDPQAFTQGLLWHDGKLYESTGLYGRSTVRRVDLQSGRVEEEQLLPPSIFGEGLALAGDTLVQLSWREGQALLWDRATLARRGERAYDGEGWGLTTVGSRLLQSDGSTRLTWRDARTLAVTGTLEVRDGARAVPLLNELEAVGDVVYANIWTTDRIVRIDLASGAVTARIDATPLHDEILQRGGQPDVLNGIAWRPEAGTFLVTGKLWPVLFEVRLRP